MSFLFDGSDQALVFTLAAEIDAWPITVIAKFKDVDTVNTNDRCVVDFTEIGDIDVFFRIGLNDSDGTLRLAVRCTGSAPALATSDDTPSKSVWQTGAWEVVDDDDGYVRANGSSRGSTLSKSIPGDIGTRGFQQISIGYERNSSTDPWDGNLAEIAIYTAILTDQEHIDYADGDKPDTIQPENLVLYLSLDSDSVTDEINSYVFTKEGTVNAVYDSDHPVMNGGGGPAGIEIFRRRIED